MTLHPHEGHDHGHDHGGGQGHGHDHSHADVENPFAGQGAVLLDIGGDVGALVVEMPAAMVGVEIEVRPTTASDVREHVEDGGHHPHVAVVDRPAPVGTVPSLVYGELVAGSYVLGGKDGGEAVLLVTITGGAVTTVEWPSSTG